MSVQNEHGGDLEHLRKYLDFRKEGPIRNEVTGWDFEIDPPMKLRDAMRCTCLHCVGGESAYRLTNGGLYNYFAALSARLRRVRVCCGDWMRVCGYSPTTYLGTTAVFLDPPYGKDSGRSDRGYAFEVGDVARDVHEWCVENQDNPKLRIALCGYEGEYDLPGWECLAWKAHGGYGVQGNGAGRANRHRERVWFSPNCLKQELLS